MVSSARRSVRLPGRGLEVLRFELIGVVPTVSIQNRGRVRRLHGRRDANRHQSLRVAQ
jgi:hypothetical protein